jgi:hypothetical protein
MGPDARGGDEFTHERLAALFDLVLTAMHERQVEPVGAYCEDLAQAQTSTLHDARPGIRNATPPPDLSSQVRRGVGGSPGWTRTNNPPVNSRMLCQLSYRGSRPQRLARGRRRC